MSILTHMDFSHLGTSDKMRMAEIEERLRGLSGQLPSNKELGNRLAFLESSMGVIRSRVREEILLGICLLILVTAMLLITQYDVLGFELSEMAEGLAVAFVVVAMLGATILSMWKYRRLPSKPRDAELEIQFIKHALSTREHRE